MKKQLATVGAATLILLSLTNAVDADAEELNVKTNSDNTLIYNETRDELLYSENPDEVVQIGSLTKLMTSYILIDCIENGKLKLDDKFKISKKAWQSDFPKMYLEVGHSVKVNKLLEGILVANGNDAAIQIAEAISGDTESFTNLMNEYAKKMKMEHTTFESPDGSLNDRSTASDLLKLTLKFDELPQKYKKYLVQEEMSYETRVGKPITVNNGNAFVLKDKMITGLSTSSRKNSHQSIVTTAEKGNNFIAIVLDSNSSKNRNNDVYKLINFGYKSYKTLRIAKAGDKYDEFKIYKSNSIGPDPVQYKDGLNVVVKADVNEEELEYKYEGKNYIEGGLKKGKKLGVVKVYLDGEYLGEDDIVSATDYKKSSGYTAFIDGIALKFKKLFDKIL